MAFTLLAAQESGARLAPNAAMVEASAATAPVTGRSPGTLVAEFSAMVSMVHLLVAAWLGVPAPTAADRTAFEVSLGAGAHSGLLVTTELHGFLGPVLSDASARAVHALGYQVRLEFAPLLYVHAVDKTRSLLHAHHLAGVGLVGPRRRLFWSAGIGMGFSPFGIGPDVEGRIGYALGRRPRLRWILGLHARTGFAIAYHQIPTTAVGAFVGLLRF